MLIPLGLGGDTGLLNPPEGSLWAETPANNAGLNGTPALDERFGSMGEPLA